MKEPGNSYDGEAIKATMKHIRTVGYVANSPYTVAIGTKVICRDMYGRKKKKEVVVFGTKYDEADSDKK